MISALDDAFWASPLRQRKPALPIPGFIRAGEKFACHLLARHYGRTKNIPGKIGPRLGGLQHHLGWRGALPEERPEFITLEADPKATRESGRKKKFSRAPPVVEKTRLSLRLGKGLLGPPLPKRSLRMGPRSVSTCFFIDCPNKIQTCPEYFRVVV